MPDIKKVIKGLQKAVDWLSTETSITVVDQWVVRDALALLKAQEHEASDIPKPDSDIGCWYDITHNYTLEQVVSALKAQESVKTWFEYLYAINNPDYFNLTEFYTWMRHTPIPADLAQKLGIEPKEG